MPHQPGASRRCRASSAASGGWSVRWVMKDQPEAAAIAVNEIICADPACPGNETVILVMKPGEKTRAYKLQMAMAEVTAEALAEALRS